MTCESELIEAEKLINLIESNEQHPAINHSHPRHSKNARALKLLKIKCKQARQKLKAESFFQYKH